MMCGVCVGVCLLGWLCTLSPRCRCWWWGVKWSGWEIRRAIGDATDRRYVLAVHVIYGFRGVCSMHNWGEGLISTFWFGILELFRYSLN